MNESLQNLTKRIKQLREERNLTQADVYYDTGVNVGRIEQGKRDISYTTLIKLCNYFKISLSDFADGLEE